MFHVTRIKATSTIIRLYANVEHQSKEEADAAGEFATLMPLSLISLEPIGFHPGCVIINEYPLLAVEAPFPEKLCEQSATRARREGSIDR